MKPFCIVHVLTNLGPGGAEMGVIRLAEALQDDEFDHHILVLGTNLSLQEATNTKIPCHSLGLEGSSYTAFLRLAKALRSFKSNLVHVNNLSPWLDAALAARLAGCPCIMTFHGVEQGRLQFSRLKKKIFRTAARMSAAKTAVADPAADLLTDLTGISRQEVQVIPNGIDTNRFYPVQDPIEKADLRKKFELPVDALLLGCVAALRPVKNHSGLIRAFARVADRFPEVRLVLVGEGTLEKQLRHLVREHDIEERVLFLGARRDVPSILKALDVFILNSETEGLSYSMLEAMASGLPVVATDVGANPQLITQGQEGFLVPEGDLEALEAVLEQVFNGRDRLPAMGENAWKRVDASFGLNTMIEAYRDLYRQTIMAS